MIAILSVGDELMTGEIVDTNFAHIARGLYAAGLRVNRHLTVGDGKGDIAAALRDLAAGHEVVIVTGGLGPTSDDRTAAAAADASGQELQLNEPALIHVRRMTARFGGTSSPANDKQALIPSGATLITNPLGTAPGFVVAVGGCRCFFLPGVPREMERMLAETVLPALAAERKEQTVYRTREVRVFGRSEADLGAVLAEITVPGVDVAFCVDYPEILVKLRAEGSGDETVEASLRVAVSTVRELVGEQIISDRGESLDAVLARLLRGQTLAVAESCTGGLIAKRLTDRAGSSAYFIEGAVTYSNEAKTRRLGVPAPLIEKEGAVSAAVARAMAEGVRTESGSDLALAVTGVAGPDGGSPDKPVGTVFIALADRVGSEARRFSFAGDREQIRTMTAVTALDWLRRHLQG